MFFTKFHLKVTLLTLSLLALSAKSELFAKHCDRHQHHESELFEEHCDRHHNHNRDREGGVTPAQANYQDGIAIAPVVGEPITFSDENFRTNVNVNYNGSVFEVKVPGLYSIDSFLLVNAPAIGDSVAGYITINDRQLLTFYSRETATTSQIVELHFNDRLVYLEKGDRVSVILTEFTPGTLILGRGFVLVALNNSH